MADDRDQDVIQSKAKCKILEGFICIYSTYQWSDRRIEREGIEEGQWGGIRRGGKEGRASEETPRGTDSDCSNQRKKKSNWQYVMWFVLIIIMLL